MESHAALVRRHTRKFKTQTPNPSFSLKLIPHILLIPLQSHKVYEEGGARVVVKGVGFADASLTPQVPCSGLEFGFRVSGLGLEADILPLC